MGWVRGVRQWRIQGFHAHVHSSPFTLKVAAAVLMASNCRETASHFANYTGFNGSRGNPSGSDTGRD